MFRRRSCSLYFSYFIFTLLLLKSIDAEQSRKDAPNTKAFLNFIGGLVNEAKEMLDNSVAAKREAATCNKPIDCADVYNDFDYKPSGVYKIWPKSRILNDPIDVFCDMEDDGGGWTVFQRRGEFGNPQDFFYKNWKLYKFGFGGLSKEFWIGNDNLFALTNQRDYTLKIILKDYDDSTYYATYDEFWVADEVHNYTLHVSGYAGTAGDSFSGHSNFPFSTYDKDNDIVVAENCALKWTAAWWYRDCYYSNLNGLARRGQHPSSMSGINWKTVRGDSYSFKNTVMKLKPNSLFKRDNLIVQKHELFKRENYEQLI